MTYTSINPYMLKHFNEYWNANSGNIIGTNFGQINWNTNPWSNMGNPAGLNFGQINPWSGIGNSAGLNFGQINPWSGIGNSAGLNFGQMSPWNGSWNYSQNQTGNIWGTSSNTSSSSSSTNTIDSIRAERIKRREEQASADEHSTSAQQTSVESDELNFTDEDLRKEKQDKKDAIIAEKKAENPGFISSLAIGGAFAGRTIYNSFKVGDNHSAKTLFHAKSGSTPRYAALYKDAPLTMQEAEGALAEASRKYHKAIKKVAGNPKEVDRLKNEYRTLRKMCKDALDSGNADEVAKVTAKIKAANNVKNGRIRQWWRRKKGKTPVISKVNVANNTDVTKVVGKKGSSFFKHLGGKGTLIMSGICIPLTLFMSKDKIKEAYGYGKDVGNKQLTQSVTEAVAPIAAYTIGDCLGKWGVSKLLGRPKWIAKLATKGIGKLVTKIAAKGVGKAIGATLGSCVPGLGTLAGLLIGTAIDVAVSKWVLPRIIGEIDAVDVAKLEHQSKEVYLAEAYDKQRQGENITEHQAELLNNNPNFCARYEDVLKQQESMSQYA